MRPLPCRASSRLRQPAPTHSTSSSDFHFSLHQQCATRSEEHTSELQSPCNLVCRLLLEKKKTEAQKVSAVLYYPLLREVYHTRLDLRDDVYFQNLVSVLLNTPNYYCQRLHLSCIRTITL